MSSSSRAASRAGAGGTTSSNNKVGTFKVHLHTISVERADGMPEDDFKTWSQCFVITRGRPNPKFWYTSDADINFGKTSVTNGNEGTYNYARNSKEIPLDDATLSDMVSSTLYVNIYRGGSRDQSKDAWIGWFSLDLAAFVSGERVKNRGFGIQTPHSAIYVPPGVSPSSSVYTGKVIADIRPDTALENGVLGGRVLMMPRASMSNPPKRWRLPALDWDVEEEVAIAPAAAASAAAVGAGTGAAPVVTVGTTHDAVALSAMTDDIEENPYKYVLTLELPGGRYMHCGSGALKYLYPGRPVTPNQGAVVVENAAVRPNTPGPAGKAAAAAAAAAASAAGKDAKGAAAAGGKTPAAATAAVVKPGTPSHSGEEKKDDHPTATAVVGTWSVEFKESRIFLGRSALAALSSHLQSGATVHASVRRLLSEPADEEDPEEHSLFPTDSTRRLVEEDHAYRGEVNISLDAMLLPGVTHISTEANVKPLRVSDTEKQADADAKVKRDAAWAEWLTTKASRGSGGGSGGGAAAGGKAKAAGAKSPAGKAPAKPDPKKAAAAPGKPDPKKGGAAPGAKGGKPATPEVTEVPVTPPPHPYEAAATVLAITVALNSALTPRPPTPPPAEVTVSDLIPSRGAALAAPPSLDSSQEFRREVANAVAAVAAEYAALIEDASANLDTSLPLEERRRDLLLRLKETGAYDGIKEALKKCAANVVRERFVFLPGYNDPAGSPGRDELLSHVYAYLVGQMHAALNATFADADNAAPSASASASAGPALAAAAAAANAANAAAAVNTSRARSSGGNGASGATVSSSSGNNNTNNNNSATGAGAAGVASSSSGSAGTASLPVEPPLLRLRRIATECEYSGHYDRAARVHQTRIALAEEAAARGQTSGRYDPAVWHDYGTFCLRRGEWIKAATCLREALSCDGNFVPSLLALSALQCARGKAEEACVYAHSSVSILEAATKADKLTLERAGGRRIHGTVYVDPKCVSENANTLPLAHAMHSLALQLAGKSAKSGAALVDAITALAELYVGRGASKDDVSTSATPGGAYLILSRYLLDMQLGVLARKSIEQAHSALLDTDAPRIQRVDILVLRVRHYLQAMNALSAYELSEYMPTGGGGGGSSSSASSPEKRKGRRLDGAPGASMGAANSGSGSSSSSSSSGSSSGSSSSSSSSSGAGNNNNNNNKYTNDYGSEPTTSSTTVTFSGRAYDGALLSAEEAGKTLVRACEISSLVSEAWGLRGEMWLAGLCSASRRKSVTGIDSPLAGAPDLGDLDVEDLAEARRWLELAIGNFVEPQHSGHLLLANTPLHLPLGAASVDGARADAMFASFSGIGGGLFASDEFALIRLHLRLATVQLQLAAVQGPGQTAPLLKTSRESYVRAVQAGRAIAAAAPGIHGGPWCLAWLGVGRAAWAENHPADAESVLGEANALDNQNPVVWAWLSYICLNAEPLRDREAAAALDNSLKNNLSGDCTETTVLLHTLADKYRGLGQAHVSAGLLRRAVLRMSDPVSGAHIDAALHARLALAEVLAEGGALEDSLNQYRAVMTCKGIPGLAMSITMKDSIRTTRLAASAAASTLLTKLGREKEAEQVMTIYGSGTSK